MTDETGQAMLAALRLSHELYLNALGAHIATLERLERVAEMFGANFTGDLAVLREQRALAELKCREMRESFERALP